MQRNAGNVGKGNRVIVLVLIVIFWLRLRIILVTLLLHLIRYECGKVNFVWYT